MKIGIDLRSLSSGSVSGVENYIVGLLDHLLAMDHKNEYVLFYNAFGSSVGGDLNFINAQTVRAGWPNKLLNAALMAKLVTLEQFTGPVDWMFLPNLNQYSIRPATKLAITVHDLSPVVTPEFYDTRRRVWHTFLHYKKAFSRANVIFAVSEYTKTDLVRLFNVPPEKVVVAYPGTHELNQSSDLSDSRLRIARNTYNLPGSFVLFLSTIEPRKNLGNLIRAFELLQNECHLVIVGKKGWKYRPIMKQIKHSPKSAKIKYIGYIEERDKAKIIKLSQAVVYPSFYEGFGFVPLEAMNLGVPIIASAVTSIPEVVGSNGLLINPYSVSEIKKALEEVLINNTLRENLITKGLEQAKKFSWSRTATIILQALQSL